MSIADFRSTELVGLPVIAKAGAKTQTALSAERAVAESTETVSFFIAAVCSGFKRTPIQQSPSSYATEYEV